MPVYVDKIKHYPLAAIKPAARRFGMQWCHLFADTLEELHALAAAIGLPRSAFQDHPRQPHYDLTPRLRLMAMRRGAIETTWAAYRKRRDNDEALGNP